MVHLFIQIPCLNEEDQIGKFLDTLPKSIEGVDNLSIVVVDDGSSDATAEVARRHGANHVISFATNRGLSAAFQAGIGYCLAQGADIIVNTDADNQYPARYIESLVSPILQNLADFAIGNRNTQQNFEFSYSKRLLQKWGTRLASRLANLEVHDAASGFRAYSREAALSINVTNPYTYTLETLIQLGSLRMKLINIPIETNPAIRPSRLFDSQLSYVKNNGLVLLRTYIQYAPLRFFLRVAILMGLLGVGFLLPSFLEIFSGNNGGHVQSLIVGEIFIVGAFQMMGIGLLADATRSLRSAVKKDIIELNKVMLSFCRK